MPAPSIGSPAIPLWGPFGLPGWFHLAYFGAWLPFAVFRARARLRNMRVYPPLTRYLPSVVLLGVMNGGLSLVMARSLGLNVLAGMAWPRIPHLIAGVVTLAAFIAVARPMWREAVKQGSPRLQLIMPRTPIERAWWIAVSVVAGIGEEISWRGVQTARARGRRAILTDARARE